MVKKGFVYICMYSYDSQKKVLELVMSSKVRCKLLAKTNKNLYNHKKNPNTKFDFSSESLLCRSV